MIERTFERIVTTPPPAPGFAGPFHTAVEVFGPDDLRGTDPFVLLMDDRMDVPSRQVFNGPHPHAGLETVTFMLEGSMADRDEGEMGPGDVLWMTAGRGVIHNEHSELEGKARVLQLWIRLPQAARLAPPRFELIRGSTAPLRTEPGATARLYSGRTGALTSPTKNHVPVTLVDIELQPASSFEQELPASYSGFMYVIRGSVRSGSGAWLREGQVGWFPSLAGEGESVLRLLSRDEGARVILYAGEPQRGPLIHRGPFIADDERGLMQMFSEFRAGKFTPLSQL